MPFSAKNNGHAGGKTEPKALETVLPVTRTIDHIHFSQQDSTGCRK